MKNIIAALLILFSVSLTQADMPVNKTALPDILNTSLFYAPAQEYTFTAGDTTTTFTFLNARLCVLTIRDSSMSGTDSIGMWLQNTYNGINFRSSVQVLAGSQTTYTTTINSALLTPTDGLTVSYYWFPGGKIMGSEVTMSGTFYVARLNQPPTAAGYQPKTRVIFQYF